MPPKNSASGLDWKADFESVRVQQMLDFRSWSLRDKFQAMEDMAEIVKAAQAARERTRRKMQAGKK